MESATPNQIVDAGRAWDSYWSTLFANNSYSSIVYPVNDLVKMRISGLIELDPTSLYLTQLAYSKSGLPARVSGIYASGAEIVRKRVVEIGSGYGFSAQAVSLYSKAYLGIESSNLINDLMQTRKTKKMRFIHCSQTRQLHDLRGTFDTAIAMNVFLHQNYAFALATIKMAADLLKKGGILRGNFFTLRPEVAPKGIFTSKAPLNYSGITAGFWFEDDEIQKLAEDAGLKLETIENVEKLNIRAAKFVKI